MADKRKPAAGDQPDDPTAMLRVTSPVRTRRRPLFLILGVALVAVLIVGSVALVNGLRSTQQILVLATDLKQGQQLKDSDLAEATVNTDAGLNVVKAGERARVINLHVTSNLPKGTVLNANVLNADPIPKAGLSVVNVTVAYAKAPFSPIRPGDRLRIVDTPTAESTFNRVAPDVACVQVVDVLKREQQNQISFDLLVKESEASFIAARAATNRVAIVIDYVDRDGKALCNSSPGPDPDK